MPRPVWKAAANSTAERSIKRKVFQFRAKPTRLIVLEMQFDKVLGMARNLLPLRTDEVARNGAFRRILRPEVLSECPFATSEPAQTP